MIEVKNVVKTFDGFAALNDATLSVPTGAVYGLVGPNGAGKSTIIRHLAGIYRQDSGEVLLDGQPVYENPRRQAADDSDRRRLVLFQFRRHRGHDAVLQGILSQFFHGAV